MSKTPVMLLQETAVKYLMSLNYQEMPVQREGQQMIFTIRVTCKDYQENGVANSKKLAKHNAAAKMLIRLQERNEIPKESLKNFNWECSSASSSTNSSLNSSASVTSEQSLSNYVGLITEYCQSHGLPMPAYNCSSMTGSPNDPTFVISCSVGKICKEGAASTKKRAKQIASEKVFDALSADPDVKDLVVKKNIDISSNETKELVEKLGFELGSLSVTNNKTVDSSEIKLVESQYAKLKGKTQINLNLIGQQHQKIMKLIENLSPMQKDNILLLQAKTTPTSKYTIEHAICSAFKIPTIEKLILRPRCGNIFMAACKLQSDPPIVHIGMGVTIDKAEMDALNKILKLIVVYLKAA